jgi:hypothetical protein
MGFDMTVQTTSGGNFHHAVTAARNLFLVDQTRSYLLVIMVAVLGAYLYTLRAQSIFACPATGYNPDTYLAYCHANHYGDYDHGAFWFGMEPNIRETARTADVLFLGSSRLQFGFSTDATNNWFSTNATSYYLMGFAYWENYLFEKELLRRLRPAAKVYVINIDTFFENTETVPAQIVMHDDDARMHYQTKHDWQHLHARLCTALPLLCGSDQAFFRSRETGRYFLEGGRVFKIPVSYDGVVDQQLAHDYISRATLFLGSLPVDHRCILLTMVPTKRTPSATARAIAGALGATLIAPQTDQLTTFDSSHLDSASAERWSKDFFDMAGPQIRRCLGKPATTTPRT